MTKKRKSPKTRHMYRRFQRDTDYATRGIVDMTKMAVGGMVGIAAFSTLASALKK